MTSDEAYDKDIFMAVVKNIDKGVWLKSEERGRIEYTDTFSKSMILYDEYDAECLIEYLNYNLPDCFMLCKI